MIFEPLPRFVFPTPAPPFLAGAKLPSMKASRKVKAAGVMKRLGEDGKDVLHDPIPDPVLETPMARWYEG